MIPETPMNPEENDVGNNHNGLSSNIYSQTNRSIITAASYSGGKDRSAETILQTTVIPAASGNNVTENEAGPDNQNSALADSDSGKIEKQAATASLLHHPSFQTNTAFLPNQNPMMAIMNMLSQGITNNQLDTFTQLLQMQNQLIQNANNLGGQQIMPHGQGLHTNNHLTTPVLNPNGPPPPDTHNTHVKPVSLCDSKFSTKVGKVISAKFDRSSSLADESLSITSVSDATDVRNHTEVPPNFIPRVKVEKKDGKKTKVNSEGISQDHLDKMYAYAPGYLGLEFNPITDYSHMDKLAERMMNTRNETIELLEEELCMSLKRNVTMLNIPGVDLTLFKNNQYRALRKVVGEAVIQVNERTDEEIFNDDLMWRNISILRHGFNKDKIINKVIGVIERRYKIKFQRGKEGIELEEMLIEKIKSNDKWWGRKIKGVGEQRNFRLLVRNVTPGISEDQQKDNHIMLVRPIDIYYAGVFIRGNLSLNVDSTGKENVTKENDKASKENVTKENDKASELKSKNEISVQPTKQTRSLQAGIQKQAGPKKSKKSTKQTEKEEEKEEEPESEFVLCKKHRFHLLVIARFLNGLSFFSFCR